MSFSDIIKKSVLENFSGGDIDIYKVIITLLVAYALAMYIHFVYRHATKNSFYFKNYGISMVIMSVITAGILLAMQSNLVISLGMVGALSIVRFRTAIKDPMDLLFLFWSIGNGIICGAGLFNLAILVSVVATIGIIIFRFMPMTRKSYLLVLNFSNMQHEQIILDKVKELTENYTIKSKNVNKQSANYIIEVRPKDDSLVKVLSGMEQVDAVSLLENDIDVKS